MRGRMLSRTGLMLMTGMIGATSLVGCNGHGKYTDAHVSLAEQKMSALKAGTEWEMGRQAFLAGDLYKASQKIENSLSLNDMVPKSHVLRGRILIEQGDLGEALEALRTAIALAPENPEAHYYLAIVHERLNDREAALKHYSLASDYDNNNAHYAVAAAEMMIDLGRPEEADAYLRSGPDFEHNAGVRQTLGHIALMDGRVDDAVELFNEACLLAPEDDGVLEDLARALMRAGDYNEAEYNLTRLLRTPENKDRRDLIHLRAEALMALDRPVEARRLLQDLVNSEEGDADVEAWISLGEVSFILRDQSMLRRAASRVVAMAPQFSDGYGLWALYYHRDGKLEKAERSVNQALSLDPESVTLLTLKAVVLSEAGRERDAERVLAQAYRIDPNNQQISALMGQNFATAPATSD